MNSNAQNKPSMLHIALACIIGLLAPSLCNADDLPERVTELTLSLNKDSLKISPINPSKARITGRVQEARWKGHDTYEAEDKSRTIYYNKYGKVISRNDKFFRKNPDHFRRFVSFTKHPKIRKAGPTRWGSFHPSKISIAVPYRSKRAEADVLTDGQFSGFLELQDGYYFSKDRKVPVKPGYTWWRTERQIVFLPENPKKPGSFWDEGYKQKITLYFIDVKDSLAEGLLTKVRIEFAEKNSRVPVKPDVRITMEDGPTYDLIKAGWEKKYDAAAVKKLEETYRTTKKKNSVRRVLETGDAEVVKNREAVEFWAFVGSAFKLETRDRNFYYFEGVFRADKAPLTKKTVLLIEIGSKLRPDDEGHGGQIISD